MTLFGIGTALFVIGLLVYLYLRFFNKPYSGASGAGMSGLPAAFAMMIAISLAVIGLLLIIASFVIPLFS
ncbi:hypothetical protein MNBD_GAMMA21-2915 [hydrothermal vent metagenome]|uniref:Uncharacterized protein n=1 Tax=hydrothermal vent metagenome TaxID=652676 RepID=A0A3B1AD50_9ZZZZ